MAKFLTKYIQWNLSEEMLARTEKLKYSRKKIYSLFYLPEEIKW